VGESLGGEPAQGGRAGVLVRLGGDQDPVGGEQDLVTRANDGLGAGSQVSPPVAVTATTTPSGSGGLS